MPSLLILLCAAAGISSVAASRHVNFYRKDYTYVDEFDAYYKIHWDYNKSNWSSAFLTCDDEGAGLFYPKTRDEWTVVTKLVEAMPTALAQHVPEIFVGIHDNFDIGKFITIHGYPTSIPIQNLEGSSGGRCVTMDIYTGVLEANVCYAEPGYTRPFVCKKVEDVSCPTINDGYQYFEETGKCYKLNNKKMNWTKAMETCIMEGGTLLVVESEFEADMIHNKVIKNSTTYYAGFKKLFNEEYYTVKGLKLSNTGFERWYYQRGQNECGTIWDSTNDGKIYLDSEDCKNIYPFICEMKVSINVF